MNTENTAFLRIINLKLAKMCEKYGNISYTEVELFNNLATTTLDLGKESQEVVLLRLSTKGLNIIEMDTELSRSGGCTYTLLGQRILTSKLRDYERESFSGLINDQDLIVYSSLEGLKIKIISKIIENYQEYFPYIALTDIFEAFGKDSFEKVINEFVSNIFAAT